MAGDGRAPGLPGERHPVHGGGGPALLGMRGGGRQGVCSRVLPHGALLDGALARLLCRLCATYITEGRDACVLVTFEMIRVWKNLITQPASWLT